jgi:hypothetical protein
MDDGDYVFENKTVAAGLTWHGLAWAFTTGHAGNWHPLTWLSHMLDCQLFGLRPGWHHFSNVAVHIAGTLFLFIALRKLTGATWRCAFVAGLFGLHPLHVESVAWVAERKDVLSATFGLSAILLYVLWTERPTKGRYAAVAVLYALSLLAKPMLVTLPLLLLLLDFWPLSRRSYRDKVPLAVLALGSCVVTVIAQHAGGAIVTTRMFPLAVRVENAFLSTVTYAIRTAWPTGLAVFYPHPEGRISAATARTCSGVTASTRVRMSSTDSNSS